MSVAGRTTYSWGDGELPNVNNIHVGTYDDKEMPAVMLFQTDDCKGAASFHMYDRSAHRPGAYSIGDISEQRGDAEVHSIMLRSGYSVVLYSDNGWSGVSELIKGAYADDNG